MHGCKEGQCSACKSYPARGRHRPRRVLDLRASRLRNGRRLHPAVPGACLQRRSTIELLNYDEEMLRSPAMPIRTVRHAVGDHRGAHPRHPAAAADLRDPRRSQFSPGQYCRHPRSRHGPDALVLDGQHAGADRPSRVHHQLYPGGMFSRLLDGRFEARRPARGDRPVRRRSPCVTIPNAQLIFMGGGAGMAPLCRSRVMAERGSKRKAALLLRRARPRDLFSPRSSRASESACRVSATCRRCPKSDRTKAWDGETA